MLYVIALFCPPLAILFTGKLLHAFLNFLLWVFVLFCIVFSVGLAFFTYFAPLIYAWAVIAGHNADKRTDRVVRAINDSSWPTSTQQ